MELKEIKELAINLGAGTIKPFYNLVLGKTLILTFEDAKYSIYQSKGILEEETENPNNLKWCIFNWKKDTWKYFNTIEELNEIIKKEVE